MDGPTGNPIELTHRTKRLSYLDIPGAGQVYVDGDYAYIGQLPNKEHLGTTIIDIKDPKAPKIVSTITLEDHGSHSHKARVIGDIMIVNHERNMTSIGRRAEELPAARTRLSERLGRAPDSADLASELGVDEAGIAEIEKAEAEGYDRGGFKLYDISDRTTPREIGYQKTGGIGVHRFDMDENYAYISTEMEGCVGNILVSTTSVTRQVHRKCRAGGCRASISPVARSPTGKAAATDCTTPFGSVTGCGPAFGMAACA